ncbi:MAG: glycosyltransferase family 4 protein [Bacteroidota bacterium]
MKILFASTRDLQGGAARATHRLFLGLRALGIEVEMLVLRKSSRHPNIHAATGIVPKLGQIALPSVDSQFKARRYPHAPKGNFSTGWSSYPFAKRVREFQPDLLHLHWVTDGFLPLKALEQLNLPTVWTLHDMWPFTGGCHYTGDCERLTKGCGQCPSLASSSLKDASATQHQRKQRIYGKLDHLAIVGISRWMTAQAQASGVFSSQTSFHTLPNGLDTSVYKPLPKAIAKAFFGISPEKKVLAFGAVNSTGNRRKGFHLLKEALGQLPQDLPTELLVFGSDGQGQEPLANFPIRYLGHLHDDYSLAMLYSAADVMVVPSIQEAFGQTVIEAMACETPVVGFDATGIRDVIQHQETGYLAQPFDAADLAQGIEQLLRNTEQNQRLGQQARHWVEEHCALPVVSRQFQQLYQAVLQSNAQGSPALPISYQSST